MSLIKFVYCSIWTRAFPFMSKVVRIQLHSNCRGKIEGGGNERRRDGGKAGRREERTTEWKTDKKNHNQNHPCKETGNCTPRLSRKLGHASRAPARLVFLQPFQLVHPSSLANLSPSTGKALYTLRSAYFPSHHRNELTATVSTAKNIRTKYKTVSNL